MRPTVLQDIAKEDLDIFIKIKKTVEVMPEIDLGRDENNDPILVSCPMLCLAFAKFFPVVCEDGYFYKIGREHSWLRTKNGCIIDVYPVALVGGPILVLVGGFYLLPWQKIYVKRETPCLRARLRDPKFLECAIKVEEVVGNTLVKLGFLEKI